MRHCPFLELTHGTISPGAMELSDQGRVDLAVQVVDHPPLSAARPGTWLPISPNPDIQGIIE
jgi:hypothetical protein